MSTTSLEDVIRDLAARGEISHISLDKSTTSNKWRGTFAMCSKFGISFAEDEDPIKALILACSTAKMKPRPPMKKHLGIDGVSTRVEKPATTPQDIEDLM